MAVPTPSYKPGGITWEDIKPDVFRYYVEEDKTLKVTMAIIQGSCAFRACESIWRQKLKEWRYKKHMTASEGDFVVAMEAERANKGKLSEFFLGEIPITEQRIENLKRLRTGKLLEGAILSKPGNVTCRTPRVDIDVAFTEESCESHQPAQVYGSCEAHASSSGLSGFELGDTTPNRPDDEPVTMLHRYLFDEIQPWSVWHMSHQLNNHDNILAQRLRAIESIADLMTMSYQETQSSPQASPSYQRSCSPELEGISSRVLSNSCSKNDEESDDLTSEASALETVLEIAATLAEYQVNYGELAMLTLKQEFELAKALERTNNFEEAEHHCRRVLYKSFHTDVQSFLGKLLVNNANLDESAFWLFSAITGFILQFALCSPEESTALIQPIRILFVELNSRTEDQDWAELASSMTEMATTIDRSISDGSVDQATPQLLIHGFSLAHECYVLQHLYSAKYMYQVLLHHSDFHLNDAQYGNQKAKAHLEYGFILKQEERWDSSAEQVLSACKSAINSGKYDNQLIAQLKTDITELFEQFDTESELAGHLRDMLARIRQQYPPLFLQQGVMSSDFLRTLTTPEQSVVSGVHQFRLPSISELLSTSDIKCSSKSGSSAAESHKHGLTWSSNASIGMSIPEDLLS